VAGNPARADFSGVVFIAEGGPIAVVRRDTLYQGSAGVALQAGDMVQTGPGAFAVIEVRGEGLIGLGPSTRVYVLKRADLTTLVVPSGWIKVDARSGTFRVVGKRLGIESQQAVMLLHVDARSDAVFDEQGSASLLLRDGGGTRGGKPVQANQFFLRADGADLMSQPRPSAEFVERMPIPFRDPLPESGPTQSKTAALQPVRAVTYADIHDWLTIPLEWRGGFVERFRGRLKDPAFFAAMDAHLTEHPEWRVVLHPPPPPEAEHDDERSRNVGEPAPH
jgi:hypothetical protein